MNLQPELLSALLEPDRVLDIQRRAVEWARSCQYDPLKFVLEGYPWKQAGSTLEDADGPDSWQRTFLYDIGQEMRANAFNGKDPCLPIRRAVSKGHGVGGSAMVAWLVNFIMSTRPHAQGTVTANTVTQLETKTWAAVRRWTKLCLTGHWFVVNSNRMYHAAFPDSWFCTPQTCRAENSEAFAGQHQASSTSFYIFDEDSAVPDVIHEVAEGGLTDGEPMMFLFGNPTRTTGKFYQACFGRGRQTWRPMIIDSRTSRLTNKDLIAGWIEEHGEDSDFVRVRVRGLPPRASDLQFIDQDRIWSAQQRETADFADDALIAGVDFSGGGAAENVVMFRRGTDARTLPPIVVPGDQTRQSRTAFLSVLANVLNERHPDKRVAWMFCDSAYGAPYVERLRAAGHRNVSEVVFGDVSPDPKHYGNLRAWIWSQMRDWLLAGCIDPGDYRLESDLSGPGHHRDTKDRLFLESKESMAKRGVASPDRGDALALTFAIPLGPGLQAPTGRAKQKRRTFDARAVRRGPGWMR